MKRREKKKVVVVVIEGRLTDSDCDGEEAEACDDILDEKGLAGSDEGGAHPIVFVVVGVVRSIKEG